MNMLAPEDLRPFKLRIEDYELLDGAGAFAMQRVELIEGVVVTVNSEHLPHTRLKNELMFRLRIALRDRTMAFEAFVEASLALPPYDMPDADIVVADSGARAPIWARRMSRSSSRWRPRHCAPIWASRSACMRRTAFPNIGSPT